MYTWEQTEQMIHNCQRCSLSRTRNLPVMGRGNRAAKIMFVAEAPGAQEDQQGVPFVGPAGRVLDVLLTSIQLKRQDIYLTNIVKCHPPANRDPSPAEQEACLPFLKCETLLLHPPIIVCLGRIAAQKLIAPQYKISRQHGTWIFRKGYWMTAVYHPSAILRDPSKLEETKQDFQTILRKLQELEDQAYPPLI